MKVKLIKHGHDISITLANGSKQLAQHMVKEVQLENFESKLSIKNGIATKLSGYDMILGMPFLQQHEPTFEWSTHRMTINGVTIICNASKRNVNQPTQAIELAAMSVKSFKRGVKRGELQVAYACLVAQATQTDITAQTEEADHYEKERSTVMKDFADVFPNELPKSLPPERSLQHSIDLLPDTHPISQQPYRMNVRENDEVKKIIKEYL